MTEMVINLHVLDPTQINLHVITDQAVGLHVLGEMMGKIPIYEGPYEFTPADSSQTIAIGSKRAASDITINPIPSNYGKITWNGSILTVS